jgi:hypothetical protein
MADWPRPEWRDLIRAVLGVVIAVVVLAILGFPGEILAEVAIVGGSGIALLILPSAGQLWWAWFKAPMRLLTAEVHAIRDRQEPSEPAPHVEPPLSPTLVMRNQIRYGNELLRHGSGPVEQRQWLDGVVAALGHIVPDDLESVLTKPDLQQQVTQLEVVANQNTPRRTTARIR